MIGGISHSSFNICQLPTARNAIPMTSYEKKHLSEREKHIQNIRSLFLFRVHRSFHIKSGNIRNMGNLSRQTSPKNKKKHDLGDG